jgi:hypothetical protein
MKIKCLKIIHPLSGKDMSPKNDWLTVGQDYLVLALHIVNEKMEVIIQSDHYDQPIIKPLDDFEVISSFHPTSWDRVPGVARDEHWLMPASWNYDGFFDGLDDEDPRAINIFNKEAKEIYRQEKEYEQG